MVDTLQSLHNVFYRKRVEQAVRRYDRDIADQIRALNEALQPNFVITDVITKGHYDFRQTGQIPVSAHQWPRSLYSQLVDQAKNEFTMDASGHIKALREPSRECQGRIDLQCPSFIQDTLAQIQLSRYDGDFYFFDGKKILQLRDLSKILFYHLIDDRGPPLDVVEAYPLNWSWILHFNYRDQWIFCEKIKEEISKV